jgi:hypothetical protein
VVQSATYYPYGNTTGPPVPGSGPDDHWGDVQRGILDFATGGIYEGLNYLGNQAQKGYQTAAQGAAQAQQGYQNLGNWNWNTAMQGLDQSQNAFNGSNGLWYATYGNQAPSAMQQWWDKNQTGYNQPQASTDAYNQYNNYMSQPLGTQTQYNQATASLGGPSATANFADYYGKQLTGNYSNAEQLYGHQNYDAPGAMEQYYAQHGNALAAPGRTEGLHYQDTTNLGNFAGQLAGLQGDSSTHGLQSKIGGYYDTANDVSRFADQQMPGLGNQGLYEQFVTADITGNNPLAQRMTDQGLARINQEMARRGGFKSGGADTAIGNFLGEMQAQDYQNRAQRAQSAQQMQLSRIGAGQSLASAAAQQKLAQGQAWQGLAGQMDTEKLARTAQQLQAQQGASTESLANAQGRLGYATAADQQALTRNTEMRAGAAMAQNAELARLQGGMSAANSADAARLARMNAAFGYTNAGDRENLARQQALYTMAQGSDNANLSRLQGLTSAAGQSDATRLGFLNSAGNMANQTTQANQQQLNDMFRTRFGLDAASAANIAQYYGLGMGGANDAYSNSINALANYYALLGQGQGAAAAVPWQAANLGVQGYGALHGKAG